MEKSKVFFFKSSFIQQCNRKRVPHRHCSGRRRRGDNPHGTCLFSDRYIERHIRYLCKGGARISGHGEKLDAKPFQERNKSGKLRRFSAVGYGDNHIPLGDHTEVSMSGLCRMQKKGRRASQLRVAAIFFPTSPDLPMPVTTTLPFLSQIRFTAFSKLLSSLSARAVTASASISSTFFATSMILSFAMNSL